MATPKTALERIQEIQAKAAEEVAKLKEGALNELHDRLADARKQVASIEAEIAELTGKPAKKQRGGKGKAGRAVSESELKAAFGSETEMTTRKLADALGTVSAEVAKTAKGNPEKFKLIKNGPQPKVKLLK